MKVAGGHLLSRGGGGEVIPGHQALMTALHQNATFVGLNFVVKMAVEFIM